eukprot:15478328-Alexandrium_andersonii.AAC.1
MRFRRSSSSSRVLLARRLSPAPPLAGQPPTAPAAAAAQRCREAEVPLEAAPQEFLLPLPLPTSEAVSYTHLRAHETSAHL